MIDVQVVLRADVSGLGRRGEVVSVAPGYARNYLLPRGLAFQATAASKAQADAMRRRAMLADAKDRESAEEVAKTLVPTTIRVTARAGEGGRLFGSVGQSELIEAIKAQTSIVIDRKAILLDEHIKSTGDHQVRIRLHHDVEFPVSVEVVAS